MLSPDKNRIVTTYRVTPCRNCGVPIVRPTHACEEKWVHRGGDLCGRCEVDEVERDAAEDATRYAGY